MSCVNSFISSFPICITFTSISCLIALARTCSEMLKRSSERGDPCLVLDLSRKASSLSLLRMMLAVVFFVDVFYVEEVPLLMICWKF